MTTQQGLRLATGVVVENMGSTVLVMVPGQHEVLTLTGPTADVVNAVVAGQPVSTDLEPEVELLLSAGVLVSPMSRRNLLRAGAIGAGAGIAVLSMPSVAAASSPPGGNNNHADNGNVSPGLFDFGFTFEEASQVVFGRFGITLLDGSGVTGNLPVGTVGQLVIGTNDGESWSLSMEVRGDAPSRLFESDFATLAGGGFLSGGSSPRALLRADLQGASGTVLTFSITTSIAGLPSGPWVRTL